MKQIAARVTDEEFRLLRVWLATHGQSLQQVMRNHVRSLVGLSPVAGAGQTQQRDIK